MRTIARITNPDVIVVELTMAMELYEWKKLAEQLAIAWPSSILSSHISAVVRQIEHQVSESERP